ncbi:MAG: cobalt transporter CbiM [Desulfovibrio sp.]|jgi:cobalt/nickel transport system permease protein|nr:cobalt transporter CbiM [Desulfovibrio sp.]
MHISEGALSIPVLAGGAVLAAPALAVSLRRLPPDRLMSAGILGAAFFAASLLHIPLGPGSVHLILNGLLGAVLGVAVFPAISAALVLQALLLQFGGLTTLGVNICIMGYPALICGYLARPYFQAANSKRACAAFVCGAGGVCLSALLAALALALSGEAFFAPALSILLYHIPIMFLEGFLTMLIVAYLARTMPDILEYSRGRREF